VVKKKALAGRPGPYEKLERCLYALHLPQGFSCEISGSVFIGVMLYRAVNGFHDSMGKPETIRGFCAGKPNLQNAVCIVTLHQIDDKAPPAFARVIDLVYLPFVVHFPSPFGA
jgi:hypothetical protein